MSDPRRWTDDQNVPDSIRDALARERSEKALLDVDAGWTKLRAAVSTMAASAEPAALPLAPEAEPAARAAFGVSWRLCLGLGLAAIAVVSIAGVATIESAPAIEAPAAPSAAPLTEPASAVPSQASDERAAAAPSLPVSELPVARVAPAPPRPHASAKPSFDDGALREELVQLKEIRASLDRDPAAALGLAEDGQRRFSNGHLVEEREGLSVLALARLGRRDEARAKARSFARRYPKSTLVDRIEAELGAVR